jgi:hypothetical protein
LHRAVDVANDAEALPALISLPLLSFSFSAAVNIPFGLRRNT